MPTNIASGGDVVAVQVGRILSADPPPTGRPVYTPLYDHTAPEASAEHTVHNVKSGNAQVGVQVDVWEGDLNISM